MKPTKQEQWSHAKKEVKKITDKLGMPVDEEIIDTVTILRLLGFNTTGSCGGHVRRTTRGPYVNIQSVKALSYTERALKMQNASKDEYRKLCRKANYYRAQDLEQLTTYIGEFYKDRPPQDYRSRLIIHSMPTSMNILQCQGAETAFTMSMKARVEMVHVNQNEMTEFTQYLKDVFFEKNN